MIAVFDSVEGYQDNNLFVLFDNGEVDSFSFTNCLIPARPWEITRIWRVASTLEVRCNKSRMVGTIPIGIIVPCLLISFGFITGPVMGWVEGITTREHWKYINYFSRLFKRGPHTRSYQLRASSMSEGNEGDFCAPMTWTIALTDFVTEVTIYNINACDMRCAH